MAQIFISHSARDRKLVGVFERAAAASNTRLVLEELESLKLGNPADQARFPEAGWMWLDREHPCSCRGFHLYWHFT